MVTKSEKIKIWLSGCSFFHVQDIDTDRLEEGADRVGVYKQAQRDVTEFVDGSAKTHSLNTIGSGLTTLWQS